MHRTDGLGRTDGIEEMRHMAGHGQVIKQDGQRGCALLRELSVLRTLQATGAEILQCGGDAAYKAKLTQ